MQHDPKHDRMKTAGAAVGWPAARCFRARCARWLAAGVLTTLAVPGFAQSFGTCDGRMFLSQGGATGNTSLYRVNTGTSPLTFPLIAEGGHRYNALAYNPADNYLYALRSNGGHELLRIASDGTTTSPTDTVTVTATRNPAQELEKLLTGNADGDASGTVSVGDVLTYTVTMTNTGNTTLANVVVSLAAAHMAPSRSMSSSRVCLIVAISSFFLQRSCA